MASGRTRPSLLHCEKEDGTPLEAVAKFSGGCDRGEAALAMEVIAACLAHDLEIQVPEPVLIDIPPDWLDSITDPQLRAVIAKSSSVAFGSTVAGAQFTQWLPTMALRAELMQTAAAILVFDAIIQNPDRRVINPNCLVRDLEIRVIDHEMCFAHGLIIGWLPPWANGSLNNLLPADSHIFRRNLNPMQVDWAAIQAKWSQLSDPMIGDYEAAIPPEWSGAAVDVQRAVKLIRDAKANIDGCIAEVKRVLQ
jgi:hypothetical protein